MVDHITILIPLVAFWFANITGIPQGVPAFKRKPFNCAKCLAFWVALAYQIYSGFTLDSVWVIALSSLGGYLWEVVFTKLRISINKG